MQNIKREITVGYKPGDGGQKPMIRIANLFLLEYGFAVGDRVDIEYADNLITITRKNSKL